MAAGVEEREKEREGVTEWTTGWLGLDYGAAGSKSNGPCGCCTIQ